MTFIKTFIKTKLVLFQQSDRFCHLFALFCDHEKKVATESRKILKRNAKSLKFVTFLIKITSK